MHKQKYKIILILTALLLTLGVAFAAMKKTLTIKFGNVTQTAQTWNVGFVPVASQTATTGWTSTTGRVCGTATITATTITVADTTLSKPGDTCAWPLTIKNSGSLDAMVTNITATKPGSTTCTVDWAGMVCGNITYKLKPDIVKSDVYSLNSVIESNKTQDLYLVAAYTGDTVNTTAVTQSSAAFTLVFGQK